MAAIDGRDKAGAIIAAALALPGLIVHAESAPEHGQLELRYLHYKDSQPGLDRISVSSPAVYVLAPLSPQWAVEASAVSDSVSGATPRYHTSISGATMNMKDLRRAGDVKVTRYLERSTWAVGASTSREDDYRSNGVSLAASFSSEDNNRTFDLATAYAADRIGSTNDASLAERRRTTEVMAGVTQVMSANDIVQANVTVARGRGFYSDPYKEPDIRPRERNQAILLTRWNHHFPAPGSTLRSSWRYYRDSFGIRAHTFTAEWVQSVGSSVTLTPSLRYYTQSAADFYFDPVYDPDVGEPYPPGYFTNPPAFVSPDQRLSAFGGVTLGIRAAWQVAPDWAVDLKVERYEQRASWRVGGSGSPGLDPFRADFVQVGVKLRF